MHVSPAQRAAQLLLQPWKRPPANSKCVHLVIWKFPSGCVGCWTRTEVQRRNQTRRIQTGQSPPEGCRLLKHLVLPQFQAGRFFLLGCSSVLLAGPAVEASTGEPRRILRPAEETGEAWCLGGPQTGPEEGQPRVCCDAGVHGRAWACPGMYRRARACTGVQHLSSADHSVSCVSKAQRISLLLRV